MRTRLCGGSTRPNLSLNQRGKFMKLSEKWIEVASERRRVKVDFAFSCGNWQLQFCDWQIRCPKKSFDWIVQSHWRLDTLENMLEKAFWSKGLFVPLANAFSFLLILFFSLFEILLNGLQKMHFLHQGSSFQEVDAFDYGGVTAKQPRLLRLTMFFLNIIFKQMAEIVKEVVAFFVCFCLFGFCSIEFVAFLCLLPQFWIQFWRGRQRSGLEWHELLRRCQWMVSALLWIAAN